MAAQLGQIRDLIRLRRFVVMFQKYGLALTCKSVPSVHKNHPNMVGIQDIEREGAENLGLVGVGD